mgnify:CR=1 FL=1
MAQCRSFRIRAARIHRHSAEGNSSISNLLPSDKAMLVRIPYFGKKGAEKYGDVILEMVRVYRKEKGLAEPELL